MDTASLGRLHPVEPLPLPEGARLITPIKMKVGTWVEMTYDAYLEHRGLTWVRAQGGFGSGQRTGWHPREDWVAMVPGVAAHVGRMFDEPDKWKGGRGGGSNHKIATIREAIDCEVTDKLSYVAYRLRDRRKAVELLEFGRRMLQSANVGTTDSRAA